MGRAPGRASVASSLAKPVWYSRVIASVSGEGSSPGGLILTISNDLQAAPRDANRAAARAYRIVGLDEHAGDAVAGQPDGDVAGPGSEVRLEAFARGGPACARSALGNPACGIRRELARVAAGQAGARQELDLVVEHGGQDDQPQLGTGAEKQAGHGDATGHALLGTAEHRHHLVLRSEAEAAGGQAGEDEHAGEDRRGQAEGLEHRDPALTGPQPGGRRIAEGADRKSVV